MNFFKDHNHKRLFQLLLLSVLALFLSLLSNQAVMATAEGYCIGENCIYSWWGTGTIGYLPRWTGAQVFGNSVIYQSGTNIGIGTTSPQGGFHINTATGRQIVAGNWVDVSGADGGYGLLGGNMYLNKSPTAFKYSVTHASIGAMGFVVNYPWNTASIITSGTTSSTAGVEFTPVSIATFRYDGNVGIGTTSPAQKLHVAGYARADSGFCIGTSCITAWPQGEVTGSGTTNYIPLWTTSSNIGNSAIYQSGTNIGIGTTTPGAKLDVSGGLNLRDRLYTFKDNVRTFENVAQYYGGSAPTTGTVVVTIGNTVNMMLEGEIVIQGYGTLTKCHFRGYTYTGSTTWHMPAATCLSSQASGGYTVRFGKRASDNARVILIGTTSSNWGSYPHISVTRVTYGYPGSGSSIGDWSISIVTDESAYTSLSSVNVNSGFKAYNPVFDGNVGIGTTSPAQKLHVAGYARADSGFCIGTSCITAWPQGEVTGSGTANYIPRWTTSSNIGNSVIYQSGTNIGIGTTSPTQQLQLSGNIKANSAEFGNGIRIGSGFGSGGTQTIHVYNNDLFLQYNNNQTDAYVNIGGQGTSGNLRMRNSANVDNILISSTGNSWFNAGNVGIGTTSPAQKLHVAGYARADSGFCIGTSCITAWPQGEVTGSGTANYVPLWTTSSNIGNSAIYQSGSRIGIGTTSPSQLLTVQGTDSDLIKVISSSDVGASISLESTGLNGSTWSIISTANEAWGGGGNLGFINNSFRLYVKADGNVGIGTTSPAQKLHVAGYARADSGFCIGTSCITAWPQGGVTGSGTTNYVPLWTTSSNIGNSVIYQSGSNIGIGTTSPGSTLDVAGNININEGSAYLYDGVQGLKLAKGEDTFYANTSIGDGAGNSTATRQTAVGYQAGDSIEAYWGEIGYYQAAVGYYAGNTNSGNYQTALGAEAGNANSGNDQTAVGYYAGRLNTGDRQTALGVYAGWVNTGDRQTAVGYDAGNSNIGNYQTAVGHRAGNLNTGNSQTVLGYGAGNYNSGHQVIGVGYEATMHNTANDVVAIGYQAGKGNAVANQFIIKQANINATPLIQGDFLSGNVGIGTTTPAQKLHVAGYARADSGFCIGTSCITAWPQGEVTGSGTANYIPRWTTSSNIGNSVIYQSGSNIGIGTTSPGSTLDVAGNININEGSAYLYDGVQGLKLAKGTDTYYANTFVGDGAGNSTATQQTAVGYAAGYSNTGIYQTALGYYTGYSNTGTHQTAVSSYAGYLNSGDYQTAVGHYAGRSNTGFAQTAVGHQAGYFNTGTRQVALGNHAGNGNTGIEQIALGYYAGYSNTGNYQTAVGHFAGNSNTGTHQTALGYYAGYYNSGHRVTGVGYEATRDNTANDVVAIGYQAGMDNAVANQFIIKQANINATPLIQGDFLSGNVGIGTTSPQEKLDVNGNVRANEYYYSSDISLKTGIGYLPGEETLSKVLKLQGVSFKWKESGKSSIGFIAQDVEKIFPELVNTDQNGLKSIQYGNLIAPLVESIKEQQKQIEQLRQEIEELKR